MLRKFAGKSKIGLEKSKKRSENRNLAETCLSAAPASL
jgi:hypothetical protein